MLDKLHWHMDEPLRVWDGIAWMHCSASGLGKVPLRNSLFTAPNGRSLQKCTINYYNQLRSSSIIKPSSQAKETATGLGNAWWYRWRASNMEVSTINHTQKHTVATIHHSKQILWWIERGRWLVRNGSRLAGRPTCRTEIRHSA